MIQKLEPYLETAFLNWRGSDDPLTRAVIEREIRAHHQGECTIFVAVQGESIVGTVQLRFHNTDSELGDGRTRGYIQALDIHPAHRRQGLATALMNDLETFALASQFTTLTLMVEPDNDPAIALYTNLGYAPFKRSSWHWKGVSRPTVCFLKTIS
ncbi:MAG: GNAT family N-acetyltransferase [Pleurocapsa sp. SU_196_0]|nr:GNAT family N-acetyltransferase [Pleurocapsa sp. SU_196_0]